jgi:hypothetical protein
VVCLRQKCKKIKIYFFPKQTTRYRRQIKNVERSRDAVEYRICRLAATVFFSYSCSVGIGAAALNGYVQFADGQPMEEDEMAIASAFGKVRL